MTWAKDFYDSMYGKIESAWKVENGELTYTATVPANTTAMLYLPTASQTSVKENGKSISDKNGIKFLKYENGRAVYELSSGNYKFTALFSS